MCLYSQNLSIIYKLYFYRRVKNYYLFKKMFLKARTNIFKQIRRVKLEYFL